MTTPELLALAAWLGLLFGALRYVTGRQDAHTRELHQRIGDIREQYVRRVDLVPLIQEAIAGSVHAALADLRTDLAERSAVISGQFADLNGQVSRLRHRLGDAQQDIVAMAAKLDVELPPHPQRD